VLLDVTQLAFAMDVANCHQPQLDSVGEHQTDPLTDFREDEEEDSIPDDDCGPAFLAFVGSHPRGGSTEGGDGDRALVRQLQQKQQAVGNAEECAQFLGSPEDSLQKV
jgi:hypothetical protein